MNTKAIIAIWGVGSQGKSATIRNVALMLLSNFPAPIGDAQPDISNTTGDFSTVITIDTYLGTIKVGFESQGDPNTGIYTRLERLALLGCDIIVCSSRTSGATVDSIGDIASKYKYETIWMANFTSWKFKQSQLNHLSAESIVTLIKEIISGRVYIPNDLPKIVTNMEDLFVAVTDDGDIKIAPGTYQQDIRTIEFIVEFIQEPLITNFVAKDAIITKLARRLKNVYKCMIWSEHTTNRTTTLTIKLF